MYRKSSSCEAISVSPGRMDLIKTCSEKPNVSFARKMATQSHTSVMKLLRWLPSYFAAHLTLSFGLFKVFSGFIANLSHVFSYHIKVLMNPKSKCWSLACSKMAVSMVAYFLFEFYV